MTKNKVFDAHAFGRAIKQKRIIDLDTDMRTVAEALKVSPSTLSRCENGAQPDLNTYNTICGWLGVSMDTFFVPKPKRKSQTTK